MKLELYRNVCGRCGEDFLSYALPSHAYGPTLFATGRDEVAVSFPDRDPVWSEVSALVDATTAAVGLTESEKAEVFEDAFAHTVDPAPSGVTFSPWGKIPCPRCAAIQRSYFGPSDPPRFVELQPADVTHKRWSRLPSAAKQRVIDTAIQDWVRRTSSR